jgi:hypothetical protein
VFKAHLQERKRVEDKDRSIPSRPRAALLFGGEDSHLERRIDSGVERASEPCRIVVARTVPGVLERGRVHRENVAQDARVLEHGRRWREVRVGQVEREPEERAALRFDRVKKDRVRGLCKSMPRVFNT